MDSGGDIYSTDQVHYALTLPGLLILPNEDERRQLYSGHRLCLEGGVSGARNRSNWDVPLSAP